MPVPSFPLAIGRRAWYRERPTRARPQSHGALARSASLLRRTALPPASAPCLDGARAKLRRRIRGHGTLLLAVRRARRGMAGVLWVGVLWVGVLWVGVL